MRGRNERVTFKFQFCLEFITQSRARARMFLTKERDLSRAVESPDSLGDVPICNQADGHVSLMGNALMRNV